jgi:hypothetical protein
MRVFKECTKSISVSAADDYDDDDFSGGGNDI